MKFEDFIKQDNIIVSNFKYKVIKTKEKQDFVVIYLDNDEKISLSIESYFGYKIGSLKGIDQSVYDKLKAEERLLLAYNGALRKLSLKDHSVKQIKEYLYTKKELHKNEVEKVLNKLTSYGLLDDEKYTINRVNYLNKQLCSVKQIRIKLSNEGIEKELIDKYLSNDYETEYAKVNKLVSKYASSVKNKSTNAYKQSILNKLVNAGFSYDISKEVIDKFNIKNDNEFELLKKEYDKAYKKYSKKYEAYDLRSHLYNYLLNKGFRSEDIKKIIGG